MSFAYVRNEVGDSLIVDVDLISGRELGSTVKVYEETMEARSYDALLIDIGTKDGMMKRDMETRALSNEELKASFTGVKRPKRGAAVAPKMLLPPLPAKRKTAATRKTAAPLPAATQILPPVASIATPTVSDDDEEEDEDMSTKVLLREILKRMKGIEKERRQEKEARRKWEENVTDDLTSMKAFIQITAQRRESDAVDMGEVVSSLETLEDSIASIDRRLEEVASNMPVKLAVEYVYLSAAAVKELDRPSETSTVFAQRLADKVFSDAELLLPIEDRDSKKVDWIIETVYRRRAYAERNETESELRSRIKAHFDQRARREREAVGVPHPVPPRRRKQEERKQRKEELAARVDQIQKEATEKRAAIRKGRVEAAAKVVARDQGWIDDDGQVMVYTIDETPRSRHLPLVPRRRLPPPTYVSPPRESLVSPVFVSPSVPFPDSLHSPRLDFPSNRPLESLASPLFDSPSFPLHDSLHSPLLDSHPNRPLESLDSPLLDSPSIPPRGRQPMEDEGGADFPMNAQEREEYEDWRRGE